MKIKESSNFCSECKCYFENNDEVILYRKIYFCEIICLLKYLKFQVGRAQIISNITNKGK